MNKLYSKYLLDEHPITFHPTLAVAIGVNEAILLQKLNLWLNCKPKEANGRSWIFNTYKTWQEQLPFFSESTIKRTIKSLDEKGLIIKGNFNKMKMDRTTWYSINYEKVDEIVEDFKLKQTLGQNEPMSLGQNDTTYTNEFPMNTNNDICSFCNEQDCDIKFEDKSSNSNSKVEVQENKQSNENFLKDNNNDVNSNNISLRKKRKLAEERLNNMAESIWEDYPKKESKVSAIKSIKQFLEGTKTINNKKYKLSFKQLVNATMDYAEEVKDRDRQYICQGSTFYNGRILDYIKEEN